MPIALGIETSCDDCSVSLVKETGEVLFLAKQSQSEIHRQFGGIVPELASRRHGELLLPLIEKALKTVALSDVDLIAVASRPGLLGSLLVGCSTAKTLSMAWSKPLVGVNHIEAHIFSPALWMTGEKRDRVQLEFPALAFVVSGGHSSLFRVENVGRSFLIAETRDDSAGEAFDKMARALGLPFPGGPVIDQLAGTFLKSSQEESSFFTKIKTDDLSFSFSGIKSQGQRLISDKSEQWIEDNKAKICAGYQARIVDHLMDKFQKAFKRQSCRQALVGGGVSANSLFRKRLKEWSVKQSVPCFFPDKIFCEDNGAMIAFAGLQYFLMGKKDGLDMPCSPHALKRDFFWTDPV